MRRKGVSQDQADFVEFYAGSRDDCLRTVLAAVRDVDRAQDLVAEAFARAWASWRRVSGSETRGAAAGRELPSPAVSGEMLVVLGGYPVAAPLPADRNERPPDRVAVPDHHSAVPGPIGPRPRRRGV